MSVAPPPRPFDSGWRDHADRAWERFPIVGAGDGVPPAILRSWRRCREVYALDRARAAYPPVVDRAAPDAPGGESDFLREARPALEAAATLLEPSDQALVLLDREGRVVFSAASARTRDAAGERLAPGARWSEATVGTNGGATCLVEGAPVHVVASQHYLRDWHAWADAAAPVADDQGTCAAVVITGPWASHHPHTLLLATALARAVEARLAARLEQRRAALVTGFARLAVARPGEGVLVLDARGLVLRVCPLAARALGVTLDAVGHPPCAALRRAVDEASRRAGEEVEYTPAGLARSVRLGVVPVDEGGRVAGSLVVVIPGAGGTAAPRSAPRCAAEPPRSLPPSTSRYTFDSLVGADTALRAAIHVGALAARSSLGVVVCGESGTGKELMAHAIHAASERRARRFVAVNCGSIPADLLEAELFGYESGAFTGARAGGQRGKFEEADGGTLLLDEIGDLPAAGQVALLRVLQEREVVRLGGHAPRAVDVRIIAATNKDLAREAAAGRFRQDLYYRLNVLTVTLPPLRERPADIPQLVEVFLRGVSVALGRGELRFTDDAVACLVRHRWPGNVRQLKNVVERVAALSEHETLSEHDVVMAMPAPLDDAEPSSAPVGEGAARELVHALRRSAWNVTQAARELGVSRMTLYRMLERHGLSRADVLTHALGRARSRGEPS